MAVTKNSPTSQDYLRMHIRADSNDSAAQAVKYLVRDGVVEYLTPLVAAYSDKQSAYDGLQTHLQGIENAANKVLRENGFSYACKAELKRERFPVRLRGL
jgi:stage II sporulation protein R